MKISQKHIQYVLLFLIVVIAFCAYQFGYVGFIEKADAVKAANKSIEARINELNEKETHRAEWEEAVTKSDTDIKDILAKYGPGNTPEKSILFVKALEENAGMQVSSISFNPESSIYVSEEIDENGNPVVEFDSSYISINYKTSYDGLKKCMDFINGYKERMNVNGFTASPDQESGQINGNMVINLFGVKDANHNYEEPVVAGIQLGTENIFGSGTGEGTFDTDTVDNVGEGQSENNEPEGGEPVDNNTGETDNTGENNG